MKENALVSNYTVAQFKVQGKGCNESNVFNIVDRQFDNRAKLEVAINDLAYVRYERMGYQIEWTQPTRDGGKDIIATINRTDGIERVYVECKLYKTTKLKVETVRAFIYVLEENKINRGVIFCAGYVSDKIKIIDKRRQIWTYEDINVLLNGIID